MKGLTARVTDGVVAFALWDEELSSYVNCYAIIQGSEVFMVDCGREPLARELVRLLQAEVGVSPDSVTGVITTHGHADHIGGSAVFSRAWKWIDALDIDRLPDEAREMFSTDRGLLDKIEGLSVISLGQHTPGSVAFYYEPAGVLFAGDHICFFGVPIEGELVSEGRETREMMRQFVAEWAGDKEAREQQGYDPFMAGLHMLSGFPVGYLCTGHGPILSGDIQEFLKNLIMA